jgi:hypothetical protein
LEPTKRATTKPSFTKPKPMAAKPRLMARPAFTCVGNGKRNSWRPDRAHQPPRQEKLGQQSGHFCPQGEQSRTPARGKAFYWPLLRHGDAATHNARVGWGDRQRDETSLADLPSDEKDGSPWPKRRLSRSTQMTNVLKLFPRSCGQATHDVALEENTDQNERRYGSRRQGGHRPPVYALGAGLACHHDRQGLGIRAGQ